ncbi:helix-turn-helix domain-containing protein [Deltaproteobacteria bacterium OttesenSCG-928-K17]|nr:helix-turn-helix domain-containing protein [Deltaproteobacteria bacterium OttesenSCG-928-K17]
MAAVKLAKIVGQAVAQQRKRKDFTQAAVAEHLRVEVETISRMETGTIAPTLKRLEQLGELFDCPVSSFFGQATISLSEQAEAIANLLSPLSKEERQLVLKFFEDITALLKKR